MGKNNKKRKRSIITALQSNSNINQTKHNTINGHKRKKYNINKMHRSKKKIQKLFTKLRNESKDSISMSLESLETSSNDTVIELTETNMNRNCIMTPMKNEASLIVINDDDDVTIRPCKDPMTPKGDLMSSPIHCSTPNISNKSSVQITNGHPQSLNNNNIIELSNRNSTREINRESFLTIDLTTETLNTTNLNESQLNTVIDLVNNTDANDVDNNSLGSTMSGDSQVTVLQNNRNSKINGKQMQKFVNGIAKLNSTERGKLLEVIAQKIFKDSDSSSQISMKNHRNGAAETAEDTYIKEVILGQAKSRNSIGSNIYNPQRDIKNRSGLRMIVIDGSNVAMHHSNGRVFSVNGLKICIEYFVQRGHIVKAFVPQYRCKLGMSTDGKMLDWLERQGLVVYTPSRVVQGRQISSYDDRYIVQCAAEFDGVIVSRDNYRDLLLENPRWRSVIENRLLQFTWVGDLIMFPRDPLGRNGPTLEEFLRHPTVVQHPTVL